MRAGIVVNVTPADRHGLSNRRGPQRAVEAGVACHIIFATADGCGTAEIMCRSGKSKPVVWTWQARFMAEGVAGLTRDKTRNPARSRCRPGPCSGSSIWRWGRRRAKHDWTGRMLGEGGGRQLAVGAAHPRSPPARAAPQPAPLVLYYIGSAACASISSTAVFALWWAAMMRSNRAITPGHGAPPLWLVSPLARAGECGQHRQGKAPPLRGRGRG